MTLLRVVLLLVALNIFFNCAPTMTEKPAETQVLPSISEIIAKVDGDWVLASADTMLDKMPRSVTEAVCMRSEGGAHDFYSEGDYWWPNPADPDGPYIRKDGMTNPENFVIHRQAMREMSITVGTLTAAYRLTSDEIYAMEAAHHLHSWFINPETRMNPNMAYAQAIKGRVPGRGVGLIDGIHFVEPAQAIIILHEADILSDDEFLAYDLWFSEFLDWMMDHEYGIDERERTNNHGTCWVLQAAIYAKLTGNEEVLDYCRDRYKTVLLPNQMSPDGSYHLELSRTKPYGYSLFNMDISASVCHILSTEEDDLWAFTLADGRGMARALEFITPFIADKSKWSYPADVMYWDEWPARHPALLFAGTALRNNTYIALWRKFPPLPETQEGLRNFPIRFPVLWYD